MKKRLEADLVSIAHRVLQLKNKSDINQLYLETQKLYEKLSVLKYIDEQYGDVKPTIGRNEIEKEMESFYNKQESLPIETVVEMTEEPLPVVEAAKNELIEETIEDNEEIIIAETVNEVTPEEEPVVAKEEITINTDFEADIKEEQIVPDVEKQEVTNEAIEEDILGVAPAEETIEEEIAEKEIKATKEETPETVFSFEPVIDLSEEVKTAAKEEAVQISFEDLLGANYSEPQFIKVENVAPLAPEPIFDAVVEKIEIESVTPEVVSTIVEEVTPEVVKTKPPVIEKPTEATVPKNLSINDKFSKGIDIDLNDRIAFVKHLFGNSEEDYNRVLNQLITFDNFYETRNFIEEMVKPDYNDWKGKDDYAERFIDIIEKKFL
ncbi:hypothetical protein HNP99_000491 [Flavobacterium sp. 28A]|uniref:hypothetical protein n=1 Tax=Flavobacterium sp. 28A TaxID=2735895 RepID=UPI001570666F|nr:hypothetical protein [Flavobacterium sp. 28A]NRT14166.1 hypothetical protein [Flavobacterium sp. 28A]